MVAKWIVDDFEESADEVDRSSFALESVALDSFLRNSVENFDFEYFDKPFGNLDDFAAGLEKPLRLYVRS